MYYYLYGFILETDIRFEMLEECKPPLKEKAVVIHLILNEEPINPKYVLPFKENIKYYLCPEEDKIYVQTSDLNYLYTSFFNIPMSFFAVLKQKAIIHCNAIEFNNKLYCFSGNKGIGKTTLALFLKKYCSSFSDDCVLVDLPLNGSIQGHRASNIFKLCKNTYDLIIKDDCYDKYLDLISQKANLSISCTKHKNLPIDKIFFIVRGNGKEFVYNEIESKITKRILLIQSIVGKDYIPKNVLNAFANTELFSQIINRIPFYILKLPLLEEYGSQIQAFFKAMID